MLTLTGRNPLLNVNIKKLDSFACMNGHQDLRMSNEKKHLDHLCTIIATKMPHGPVAFFKLSHVVIVGPYNVRNKKLPEIDLRGYIRREKKRPPPNTTYLTLPKPTSSCSIPPRPRDIHLEDRFYTSDSTIVALLPGTSTDLPHVIHAPHAYSWRPTIKSPATNVHDLMIIVRNWSNDVHKPVSIETILFQGTCMPAQTLPFLTSLHDNRC